jgi:hypothetical protein
MMEENLQTGRIGVNKKPKKLPLAVSLSRTACAAVQTLYERAGQSVSI